MDVAVRKKFRDGRLVQPSNDTGLGRDDRVRSSATAWSDRDLSVLAEMEMVAFGA
jgi:hypothetical protein